MKIDQTYRDMGWQEPKFGPLTGVKIKHNPDDEVKDDRVFIVLNYWRGFDGGFGYHLITRDGGHEDYEMFEHELEQYNEPRETNGQITTKTLLVKGPCPHCGGTDRFVTDPKTGYGHCRKCTFRVRTENKRDSE